MHTAAKIIIGLILILIGLGLFVDSEIPLTGENPVFPIQWLDNFIILVTGFIPILFIIVGLFVVWLEADELKTGKDFGEFEEKEAKKGKPKKK